jgi:7-cyano-7-deazaguanine synthase
MSAARRAVCLLSGGLDSSTCLAVARRDGFDCHTLAIDYGQRHRIELERAARISEFFNARRHLTIRVELDRIGGSALTDAIPVPKGRAEAEIGHGVPATYVPARNTVFLALALAWAEKIGAADLFLGVNALDYSGYPDCRPEFVQAFEDLARVATAAGTEQGARVKIHTPLLQLTKAGIVRLARELGVPFGLTLSCYDPGPEGAACGGCDACLLRRKGFEEAGIEDR